MKNVIKISISGLAFTLEEEGYVLLDRYLGQLKKYYAKQEGGLEVVEGIEERIAELLRERMGTPEEVVHKELIQEVMAIMGKPEDIEGENAQEDFRESYKGATYEGKPKRRIYRNIEDRVLGGVCSGLAAYFNMEPLLFRIIFVVLALFSSFGFGVFRMWTGHFSPVGGGSGWVVIAYIVLWAIIPAAKTVSQKCEMRGERPDFSGIQDRVKKGAEHFERNVRHVSQQVRRNAGGVGSEMAHGIGRVVAFCVGVVLILIAMPILIAIPVSLVFSTSVLYSVFPPDLMSLVAFNGSILWIKILGALVILLPFVGMFYGGISLIFNLHPRMRPGLIIFIGWVISLIALITMVIIASQPYYGGVEKAWEEHSIETSSDTLYVHYSASSPLPQNHVYIEADASKAYLAWFEGEKRDLRVIVYPHIEIIRVDSTQQMRIRLTGLAAGRYTDEAFSRAEETIPAFTLQDSLLTLLPDVYSRAHKWQGNIGEVLIYLPQGKQVVLTAPYRHHFDRSAPRISKGMVWKKRHLDSKWERWNDRMERKRDRWERKWERLEQRWD